MDFPVSVIELSDDNLIEQNLISANDDITLYHVPVVTIEDEAAKQPSVVTLEDDAVKESLVVTLEDDPNNVTLEVESNSMLPIVTLEDDNEQAVVTLEDDNEQGVTVEDITTNVISLEADCLAKSSENILKYEKEPSKEIILDDEVIECAVSSDSDLDISDHIITLDGDEQKNAAETVIKNVDISESTSVSSKMRSGNTKQCKICHNKCYGTQKNNSHACGCIKNLTTKQFKCDICEEIFTDKITLMKHSKTHKDKPFICDICFKAFGDKNILRMHYNTHTGEKPFACTICDKVFSNTVTLRNHYQIHIGEKPYVCDVCLISFDDKSSLCDHKLDQHHFLTVI